MVARLVSSVVLTSVDSARRSLRSSILPRLIRDTSSRSSTSRPIWLTWRSITARAHCSSGRAGPVVVEDLDRVAQRRQRVAQLVGEDGEELVLAAIRLGQRVQQLGALLFRPAALQHHRGLVGGDGQQQAIGLVGKVGADGARGQQADVVLMAERQHHQPQAARAGRMRYHADLVDARRHQPGSERGDGGVRRLTAQRRPPVVHRLYVGLAAAADAHVGEVEPDGADEELAQTLGDLRAAGVAPDRRQGGEGDEIADATAKRLVLFRALAGRLHAQAVSPGSPARARSLSSRRNSSGGTKKGFSCRMPPMITIG